MTPTREGIEKLLRFIAAHPRLVVLTGAGASAESGIPTYRDHQGNWQHSAPVTQQAFTGSERSRCRYWQRSFNGWPNVRDARPNAAHLALATMERLGIIQLLITQNVDRLHQRAGSTRVVDLHGRLDRVACLACGRLSTRDTLQRELMLLGYTTLRQPGPAKPDGDAALDTDASPERGIPHCARCQGTLMPDVVFFGGVVPADRVAACRSALADADALLVVGSSLQVYSGFRFCRLARSMDKPIALLNPGLTRADAIASLKIEAPCARVLRGAVNRLCDSHATR